MRRYRLVKEEDLETTPVQWVGVHPIRWGDRDEPTAGFVEDDSYDDLLAACECILAALSQEATFPADIDLARNTARAAIAKAEAP